ncbi:hypothetical protein [Gymnodinialimonas hymeniacidonis]|uniref:hypothetical protein n=1 Tax=Gymnodinialimonas hymeniacidonis TaxID=3126508 RepID=UPI0034C5B841
MSIMSQALRASLGALALLSLVAPASGQGLAPGEHALSVDAFLLTRSDGAFSRDANGLVISHAYQFSRDWQVITQFGLTSTAFEVTAGGSTATQDTDAGSFGLGVAYTGLRGATIRAMTLFGQIDEVNVVFNVPTQSAGDVRGLSLAYQQLVPLSDRLVGVANISVAVTEGTVTTPSSLFLDDVFNRTYGASAALAYAATPDLSLFGGVEYATSNQIMTITGDTELTRASLGASWAFSDQLDLRASYGMALGAEETNNRLSLGLTHRF